MINVNVTVKNQQNMAFTKNVMPGIPAYVVGVWQWLRDWRILEGLHMHETYCWWSSRVKCDGIVDKPEATSNNSYGKVYY